MARLLVCGIVVLACASLAPADVFVRGDVNGRDGTTWADGVWLLQYLYTGLEPAPKEGAADANDDGVVNLSDVTYLMRFGLLGGPPPPPPYPLPGEDPTPGAGTIPEDATYILSLTSAVGIVGGDVQVTLSLTNPGAVTGIEAAVSFDAEALELESIVVDGTDLAKIGPEYVEARVVTLPSLSAGILAVLVDFATPYGGRAIPAGGQRSVATLRFGIRPDAVAPAVASIGFHETGIGDPPTVTALDLEGRTIRPAVGGGTIEIQVPFIRGDANDDDRVDVADPIFILSRIFLDGDAPVCEDAADVNNDGIINIADPVFLINFLFARGPQPSEPFPVPGVDPDPDGLTCDG
ncbi:MAG: hypothetical protein JXP34_11935 [Planctomycetes bacterium]|nr:hypothetical protein [Planctomycetota bacterium]